MSVPSEGHSELHKVLHEDSVRDVLWQTLFVSNQLQSFEVLSDGSLSLTSILGGDVGLDVGESLVHGVDFEHQITLGPWEKNIMQ